MRLSLIRLLDGLERHLLMHVSQVFTIGVVAGQQCRQSTVDCQVEAAPRSLSGNSFLSARSRSRSRFRSRTCPETREIFSGAGTGAGWGAGKQSFFRQTPSGDPRAPWRHEPSAGNTCLGGPRRSLVSYSGALMLARKAGGTQVSNERRGLY